MGTIIKEPRSTVDQNASTIGTLEGARSATSIVPMAGACANLSMSAPDPKVPEKKASAPIHGQIQALDPRSRQCL